MLVLPASPVWAEDVFYLNSTSADPLVTDTQSGFLDRIAVEIFSRLGIQVNMTRLPGERSLINVNQGIDDGTLIRIGGLDRLYPNMVQVPEKIKNNEFVVFSKKHRFSISGWESLKPYDVAFINGWKIMEENSKAAKSITRVKNIEELFFLLDNGRVDLVLFEKWTGLHWIQSSGKKDMHLLTPPLAERPMFMYLNKKHRDLIPKIVNAIREIKADGTYQKVFDETLGPLFPGSP
ncbi:MAG TPA: transporter substrate-binding domain-containing protein [Nitrospiria bacterium]|nr:transporter substrate-binding domain-containing protein [Nitrospiria bacterium]